MIQPTGVFMFSDTVSGAVDNPESFLQAFTLYGPEHLKIPTYTDPLFHQGVVTGL